MSLLFERCEFLQPSELRLVVNLLSSGGLSWRPSAELGRTGRGTSLQLASRSEHLKPAMRQVASLVASRIFDALEESEVEVPLEGNVTPQVFPVQMIGDLNDPPCQLPHRDNSSMGHPSIICLYYPVVEDICGGALVLHDGSGNSLSRYRPAANSMIVIPGDVTHSVEPLTQGRRVTIVTNFYWPEQNTSAMFLKECI
jgi:hypothetical protein